MEYNVLVIMILIITFFVGVMSSDYIRGGKSNEILTQEEEESQSIIKTANDLESTKIKELEEEMSSKKKMLLLQEEKNKEKEIHLNKLEEKMSSKEKMLLSQEEKNKEKEIHLNKLEEKMSSKEKMLLSQEEKNKEKEIHLNKLEEKMSSKEKMLLSQEEKNKEKEIHLNKLEEKMSSKKKMLLSQEEKNKEKEIHLNKLEESSSDKIDLAQQEEYQTLLKQQVSILEKSANLSAKKAKEQLIEIMKEEAIEKAAMDIKNIVKEAELTAEKKAKAIVINTMQRIATGVTTECSVFVFPVKNAVKARIIGREGINIRTLEAATGIEFIVDETPDKITLSGFDQVRREIARRSLVQLIADPDKMNPTRIEEVVAKTTKNINDEIIKIGKDTVMDLGIHTLHPELIKMVGRMKFRSSYGQNLLQHSIEVAKLCETMAGELGLDTKHAKRAGLLHDIGKVWPEKLEKSHAIIGMEFAEKHKESPEVCNAIGAHHNEIEMTALISPIIQVCDAISGSKPGARRDDKEQYMQRLHNLENLAMGFDGVKKCYTLQAGRELRVIVDAENIDDKQASVLSLQISQKIEKEIKYPGQVKIIVIRETRYKNIAK